MANDIIDREIFDGLGGLAAGALFTPVKGVVAGAVLGSTAAFAAEEICNQHTLGRMNGA
ncbi:MAG: hypothetical protein AAF546_06885 [Verrucomicrobiota bacterium]